MSRNEFRQWTYFLLIAALWLTPGLAAAAEPEPGAQDQVQQPVLTPDDCQKCHTDAPRDILAMGGAHRSEVTCIDCHDGHPPNDDDIIPQCSNCHTGRSHFELEGCLSCHSNPHTPLAITLAGDITEPCLTCHTEQITQLREHQSAHTTLFCNTCHTEHGVAPECFMCHEPHAAEMTQTDCVTCHRAHMPLVVTYPDDIPSKYCGSCHTEAFSLLSASKAKHAALACSACHQEKHKTVPHCTDCHGIPHPEGMMQKFPQCGDCHGIAHNLNK